MKIACLQCSQVGPHKRAKLEGNVWDPLPESMMWKISKTAEYPVGLCMALARTLRSFLETLAGRSLVQRKNLVRVGRRGNMIRADWVRNPI